MSDADPDASSGDELSDDGNPSAPPRRFTMKALGQLVDPESIAAPADEGSSNGSRPATRPSGMGAGPGSRRRLQQEVSGRASRPESVTDLSEYEPDESPVAAEVRGTPTAPIMAALARAAAQHGLENDDAPAEVLRFEPDEGADETLVARAAGKDEAEAAGDEVEAAAEVEVEAEVEPQAEVEAEAEVERERDTGGHDEAPAEVDDAADEPDVVEPEAEAEPTPIQNGNGAAPAPTNGSAALVETRPEDANGTGDHDVDDSESGSARSRFGDSDGDDHLASPLGDHAAVEPLESSVLVLDENPADAIETATNGATTQLPGEELPLARHMLAAEVRPGGRLSDPHDVPGIVLNLAKDLPAAAAVSVVGIDQEIELVGNTIDPDVDPNLLASVFSGVFRTLQQATGILAAGPLGRVHDLVIEAEHMDLVLRPLGAHYYLLVLEDRRSPNADLAATRLHMAAIAPGLAATLAQLDALDS